MAGEWIPVEVSLPGKPEVAKLSVALRKSIDEIVGMLIRFWIWVQAHTADGKLPGIDAGMIAAAAHLPERFVRALEDVGWLQITEDGCCIPNFDRWLGRGAKRRLQMAERVTRHRADQCNANVTLGALQKRYNQAEECNANVTLEALQKRYKSVTEAAPSPPSTPLTQREKEQNRREEGEGELRSHRGGTGGITAACAAGAGKPAPSPPSGDDLAFARRKVEELWRQYAEKLGLPPIRGWPPKRIAALKSRLRDPLWLDDFERAVRKLEESPFLQGVNERGWKATIDWLLRPESVNRVLEGQYDDSEDEFWRDLDAR